jgi:hypothetical protein
MSELAKVAGHHRHEGLAKWRFLEEHWSNGRRAIQRLEGDERI